MQSFVILLLVAAVIVVAIYVIFSQKRKIRQALQNHEATIQQILQENQVLPESRKQLIYQNVFIDRTSRQLVLIDHRQAKYSFSSINLEEIGSCRLKQITDTVVIDGEKNKTETIIRQIGIEIVPRQKHMDFPMMVFYDANRHSIYVKTEMENDARDFMTGILSQKKTAICT